MSKQKQNLKIACALDWDVLRQVVKSKPTVDRAKYDFDVVQALKRLYTDLHLVPVSHDPWQVLDVLRQLKPDVVFNLALSAREREPSFVGCLDFLGIPYTGSGASGIALGNDKIRSRELLRVAGVRVPRFVGLPIDASDVVLDLTPPVIVKPAYLGASSDGIYNDSVVNTTEAAMACARRIWTRFGVPAVCDEFIVGRELRIGVIEDAPGAQFRLVGIGESLFPGTVPGWGFKSEGLRINPRVRRARGVETVAPQLPKSVEAELLAIANTACLALDQRGYATLDVRMDDFGRITVLEINANPGLYKRSLIWSRPSFTSNIHRIVQAALER
ncbi:MAG TPA: hypothetical protein VF527_17890 [Pyrinomonadaceae bacterium]